MRLRQREAAARPSRAAVTRFLVSRGSCAICGRGCHGAGGVGAAVFELADAAVAVFLLGVESLRGSQAPQRLYEELISAAATHKLRVDFHGAYTPTGLERTWPNSLTLEAVLGEVYVKLNGTFTPEHMMKLPFTRALTGPADVTPGGFVTVREDQFRPGSIPSQVVGTRARQLALAVLMDSPCLCLCDSPENYLGQQGVEFYRALPTVWGDTRVLSAEIMEHLVQARRKGEGWWIAGMDRKEPLTLTVELETRRTVTAGDQLEIRMETARIGRHAQAGFELNP